MKTCVFAVMFLALGGVSSGQTVLIDPNAEGGFENGPSLAANGWSVANDGTNKWEVGGVAKASGSNGAFISHDGGITNTYLNGFQASHFYRDVEFPAGEPLITLEFSLSGGSSFDNVTVFLIPPESTPIAGIELTATGRIGGDGYAGINFISGEAQFRRFVIVIPSSFAGTIQRLVFSWRNDETDIIDPAGAIDNISLQTQGGITTNSTGGGPWSSGSTWDGGIVPGPEDPVLIHDGDAVTIDGDVEVGQIIIGEGTSGALEFTATGSHVVSVGQSVIVAAAAFFSSGTDGTSDHRLEIAGDLFNNGTLSLPEATIAFTGGSDSEFNGTGLETNINKVAVEKVTQAARLIVCPNNLKVLGLQVNTQPWVELNQGTLELWGNSALSGNVLPAGFTIPLNAAMIFNNPNLTSEMTGTCIVSGSLEIREGTCTFESVQNDGTCSVAGGTLNITNVLTNNGTFNQNGGTTVLLTGILSDGSSMELGGEAIFSVGDLDVTANATWEITGQAVGTVTNMTVGGLVTVGAPLEAGELHITATGGVVVDGDVLEVSGNTTVDGSLHITSNAENGLVVGGSMDISGGATWTMDGGTATTGGGVSNYGAFTLNVGNVLVSGTFVMSNGSTVNISGPARFEIGEVFCTSPPSSQTTVSMVGGCEVIVGTIGVNSSVNATFDLGSSSQSTVALDDATIIIRNSNTAATTPRDFRIPSFANVTVTENALVRFGDSETPAPTTFRVEGIMPPHVVDGSHTIMQSGNVTFPHPTTIVAGEIWNVNGSVLVALQDLTVESGATLDATVSGSVGSAVAFRGTTQQTFTNNGTSSEIRVLEINNTSGADPGVVLASNTTLTSRLSLVNGTLGGSATLTIGNSSVSSNFTTFRQNGGILLTPAPGADVIQNVQYLGSAQPTVTGNELPELLNGFLTINNSQGVILNGPHTVAGLTLSSGTLTTSADDMITVSGTTPAAVSATSGTSFVVGPMQRIIDDTSPAGSFMFPIGNTTLNTATLVDPVATGPVVIEAQVYEGDAGGTPGSGLATLNNDRYWRIDAVDGVEVFVEALIAFTSSGLGGGNHIGKSETLNGTYNSIGGTVGNGMITSNTVNGFSYFVIGTTSSTLAGGTYLVGASQSLVNLTEVASTLASNAISGNVIFELQSDYDGTAGETLPITFIGVTSVGGDYTVTIRPAAGAGLRTTSGDPGSGNPVINLDGGHRLTFDGREGGSGETISWILRNTRTTATVGPVVRFVNGATNNVLQYTRIEGQNTTTTSGLILFSTTTNSSGNSGNVIAANEIRSRSDVTGVPANLIYSAGTTGTPNADNQIVGNRLFDFTASGINLAAGGMGNGWTIEDNNIYQTAPITNFASTTGILVAGGTGHVLAGNIIGGSEPAAGGTAWTANASFTGINLTLGTTATSTVAGNVIRNVSLNGTFSAFTGIRLGNGTVDLTGNIIGDPVIASSIVIGAGSEAVRGIFMDFTNNGTVNITGSVIANIAQTSGFPGEFRGIHVDGTGAIRVSRNLVHTTGPTGTTAFGLVRGINVAGTFATTKSFTIDNNMISLGAGITNDCQYQGIRDGSVSGTAVNVYFNSVRIGGTANGTNSTYAYRRDNTTAVTLMNNILTNMRTGGTGFHAALANAAAATGWSAGSSDFNMLTNDNDQHLTQWLGTAAGNNRTLAGWQASQTDATPGSGGDANSLASLPHFTAETDLHLDLTSVDVDYIAQPIAGITTDFDGDARSTSSPYKGADENTVHLLPDVVAPVAPANLAVTDSSVGAVALRWNRNTEPDIMRYRVYGDVSPHPTAVIDSTAGDGSDTVKTITGLLNGTRYYFRVTAVDSAFNESGYSAQVNVVPGDYTAPAAPQDLAVTDSSSGTITIQWRKSTEPDFLRYRIYRAASPGPVARTDSTSGGSADTSKAFTGLVNGTRYYFRVTSVDTAGNESAFSNEVNATPGDRSAPAAPQNLVIADSGSSAITIRWNKSPEPDFLLYRIYHGTAPNPSAPTDSAIGGRADTSKTLGSLTNGTRYYLRVTAVDSAGNESAFSNEVHAAPNALTSAEEALSGIPEEFTLFQNYPNPFNPSTLIRYGLPERSTVRLEIFDVLGRSLAVLVDEEQDARYYQVSWEAPVPSGIYFYRITAAAVSNPGRTMVEVRKMVLMR